MHTATLILILGVVLCVRFAEYESIGISPKLDFVESREESPGKGKSPKIQGVRVVVDTTKTKKSTESKSVEDDSETAAADGDGTSKTVGIRTDITLEITEEDDDGNKTTTITTKKRNNNNNKPTKDYVDSDENDSDSTPGADRRVPIIKGSSTGGGAPKPAGTNVHQRPLLTSEEGWNVHNVPIVYGKDSTSSRRNPNGVLATENRWDTRPRPLPPPTVTIWTTEQPHYYLTDYHHARNHPSFKTAAPVPPSWTPIVAPPPSSSSSSSVSCRCPHQPQMPPPSVHIANNYPPSSTSQWKTYRPDLRTTFVRPLTKARPIQHHGSSSRGVDDKLEYPFTSSLDSEY